MLAELRAKSQITLPRDIVKKLGLSVGDSLDVSLQDDAILLMPVVAYPRQYVDSLCSEIKAIKARIDSGEQPTFDSVDAMLAKLEED